MSVDHSPHGVKNSDKLQFTGQERQIGHFVGRVQHSGHRTADHATIICQTERGKRIQIHRLERKRTRARQVELAKIRGRPFFVRKQRILDRNAHVRRPQLRQHGAVAKFHQRVDDALRMDQHIDG